MTRRRHENGVKLISKFIFAARSGNINEIQTCLKLGVDPNIMFDDTTALHVAVELENLKILLILTSRESINMNVRNPLGDTPLITACQKNASPKLVKILLKNGANPNLQNKFGKSALHSAVMGNSIGTAMELIKHGAVLDVLDEFGNSPLSFAVIEKSYLPMVKLLINKGANPNLNNPSLMPMFLRACLSSMDDNSMDIIKYLIGKGVNLQVEDPVTKNNALHIASLVCNPKLASILLENGVDIYKKDDAGRTPLIIARVVECSDVMVMYSDFLVGLEIRNELSRRR